MGWVSLRYQYNIGISSGIGNFAGISRNVSIGISDLINLFSSLEVINFIWLYHVDTDLFDQLDFLKLSKPQPNPTTTQPNIT